MLNVGNSGYYVINNVLYTRNSIEFYEHWLIMIFFIWVLRPFQEYFTYIEPVVHRRWAKTGEPGEKPPDHP